MFDATVEVTMAARLPTVKFNCLPNIPSSSSSSKKRVGLKPAFCSAVQQVEQQIGYILCTKCKVFKCVTFPDQSDGEQLSF
ncbi:Guanine nucleotide-binding protein-like 3 [Bienertia sinuspersici]